MQHRTLVAMRRVAHSHMYGDAAMAYGRTSMQTYWKGQDWPATHYQRQGELLLSTMTFQRVDFILTLNDITDILYKMFIFCIVFVCNPRDHEQKRVIEIGLEM